MLKMFARKEPNLTSSLDDILGDFTKTLTRLRDFVSGKEAENDQIDSDIDGLNSHISDLQVVKSNNFTEMNQANRAITKIKDIIGEE